LIAAKAEKERLANEAKARQIAAETKAKQERAAAETAKAEAKAKRDQKSDRTMAWLPLPPPKSPVSVEKQQRLAELLEKYKAEAITPQQYHDQRARILTEP